MRINNVNSQIGIKNNSFNILNNKRNVDNKMGGCNFSFYPCNYYLSFNAKKTPKKIINEVGEGNFPSQQILQTVKNAYKNDTDFSLYNAHIEYYKALLECKTLDEAKEKYSEFQGVIDAKDINYKDMSYTLKQISRGESEVQLKDLSLELLKKYYAQALSISNNQEKYYRLGIKAIRGIFQILNIPFMDRNYLNTLYMQESGFVERASLKTKLYHDAHPEKGIQHSEFMKKYCAKDDVREKKHSKRFDEEEKAYMSLIQKQYCQEHPERAKAHGQYMRQYYIKHPEYRTVVSDRVLKFYSEHPEYSILQSYIYTKLFPDYVQTMADIAKEFPAIGIIRRKEETGTPLTDSEKSYNKKYFARCNKEYPGIKKEIGAAYSYLIKMFKISPECDSNKKIGELNEFFNNDKKVKEFMLQIRGCIIE